MKLLVNICGAPSAGKSALAAGVFAFLKWRGVSCELVTEFAKDKVWEESVKLLDDQLYVFGEQLHRVNRLRDKVDVVITDSSLLNSIVYYAGSHREAFFKLVREVELTFNTLDILVTRAHPYETAGRYQTESEAEAVHHSVLRELAEIGKNPLLVVSDEAPAKAIAHAIASSRPSLDVASIAAAVRSCGACLPT